MNMNQNRVEYKQSVAEEFIRQVLFVKDDDKVLAVFPFYHEISDLEYNSLVESFYETSDEEDPKIPKRHEFCLMNEEEFGWGWIHSKMIQYLDLAEFDEYDTFRNALVDSKVIKSTFILNEE